MGEIAGAGILLKAIGWGLIPGIAMLVYLIMSAVLKFVSVKQEGDRKERLAQENADREEHMIKWDSMMKAQDKLVAAQKEVMQQIIIGNREDLDRLYSLYKEQGDALRVLMHNVTTLTTVISQKTVCPHDIRK